MIRISTVTLCLALVAAYAHAQTIDAGKRQFQARCLSCHGEDGTGGARGVSIVGVARPRATSTEAVRDLIAKGIPNRGMPAFSISDEELDSIAAYVVSLMPSAHDTAAAIDSAPGNAAAGERFFAGKGNCTSCHMVRGRGGVLGPDLSNIGRDRTVAQIERALRDPGSAPPTAGLRGDGGAARGDAAAYRAVTVHLGDGGSIRGLAKNESPFDLQLLGVDGELHLLLKEQVAEVVREPSLMPKVDATPGEIRDLVAYLAGLGADPRANANTTL